MGERSQAQENAAMRNWGIRQLRALQAQARVLSPARSAQVRALIDEELVSRGADTEEQHISKERERFERLRARDEEQWAEPVQPFIPGERA